MADRSRQKQVRIAAAVLGSLLAAAVVFTYLAYTSAFSKTDTVTVNSPRAGLVMERDAKVKFRGVQVGKVRSIKYRDDGAQLTLTMDSGNLHYIPSNSRVYIASNTIFGAKAVEFMPPEGQAAAALRPGATVEASEVQVEVNTLFQSLTNVLNQIDPVELNGVMTALAEGFRGNGDNLGALLSGLNVYLADFNAKLPQLEADIAKAATVAGIYGDSAPAMAAIVDNVPTINKTLIDQRRNLNEVLLATTGLANTGYETLAPGAEDFIDGVKRFRALSSLLAEYSPEFPCLFNGLAKAFERFGPSIGGTNPALFVHASFIPGAPAYTFPESLPIVNAKGGPNCRGLPNIPSKSWGGSWYRSPFLVTDNAYIPYEPPTELTWDAPSVAQFLYNGMYAERDEY